MSNNTGDTGGSSVHSSSAMNCFPPVPGLKGTAFADSHTLFVPTLGISPDPRQHTCRDRSLTNLLQALKSLRRVYLESHEACTLLSNLIEQALTEHPTLQQEFSRFGWVQGSGFVVQGLDVNGLSGALKKYKYEKLQLLGSGSYGQVYKARDVETGEFLAIKKLVANRPEEDDCGLPDSTVREITTLRELTHPNVVK